jgi:hypothetical protein
MMVGRHFLEQNTIILLGASLAAGAALGLSIQSSEPEGDLGEMARKVKQKAQIKKEQFNQELREKLT